MGKQNNINPAYRAAAFVQQFRQASAPPVERRNESSVRHALARMYGCDSSDEAKLAEIMSRLWKIPNDTRRSLNKVDGLDTAVYDPTIKQFETMLSSLILNSDASSIKNHTPSTLENALEMIGAYLNLNNAEIMPSETKLNELLKDIAKLSSEIKDAGLDSEFTDYFLHRLDELQYALNHYNTLGPDEVLRRVDEMFGSLIRQYPEISKSPKKQSVASKLWTITKAVAVVMDIANGSFTMIENYNNLTTLESGVIAEIKDTNDKK